MQKRPLTVPTTRSQHAGSSGDGAQWRGRSMQRPAYAGRRTAGQLSGDAVAAGSDLEPPQTTREAYRLGGLEGVIRQIATLALEGQQSAVIRRMALRLTDTVAPDPATRLPDRRRFNEMASVIYDWTTANIAYVHDPANVESLESATYTLKQRAGDCDAHTVLGMSLLSALGIDTRMVLIGTDAANPQAFTHIYLDYRDEAGQWRAYDTVLATHIGDAVPESAVTIARVVEPTKAVEDGGLLAAVGDIAGAPVVLQTLRGLGDLGVTTKGPVSGPDAWLQIEQRSHDGRVPSNESYWIDVFVEASYDFLGTCDVDVYVRNARSSETIARATIDMSKWTGIETCEGRGRINFPRSFDPSATEVIIQVIDPDLIWDDDLGSSQPLFLQEQQTGERPGWWDDATGGAQQAVSLAKMAVYVGLPVAALFVARPYVEDFIQR